MSDDETPGFDDVMTAARRWYYAEIRDLVDDAIRRCNAAKPDDPREWLSDDLHKTIDGHSFVIYTGQAAMALAASDNDGAMKSKTGSSGTTEQRCYYAMRADAWELLGAREDEWAHDDSDIDGGITC